MSTLCQVITEFNSLSGRYLNDVGGLIEVRSTTGRHRYYKPSANTNVARMASLQAALTATINDDVVVLLSGKFAIPAGVSLINYISVSVTGVTIETEKQSTYTYDNPEDGVTDINLFSQPRSISNVAEFVNAISGTVYSSLEKTLLLTRVITLVTATDYIIPRGTTIKTAGPSCKFVQPTGGTARMYVYGHMDVGRTELFKNFRAGQVRGTMKNDAVFPDWWGFKARTGNDPNSPTNALLLDDDRPINCALHSGLVYLPTTSVRFGTKVLCGHGNYFIARPLDLTNTSSTLEFAGANKSVVYPAYSGAVSAFQMLRRNIGTDGVLDAVETTAWMDCEYWPEVAGGNHGAMVLIGGDNNQGSQNTFRCQVKNVYLAVGNIAVTNWDRHVSGITSRWTTEEQTTIDTVLIEGPSGFGIGFARHYNPVGTYLARGARGNDFPAHATVNGMTISNFQITGPTKRDAVAIRTGDWSYQFEIRKGTIDMRLQKSISSVHSVVGLDPNHNPGYTYGDPGQFADPRTASMIATGSGPDSYYNYPDYGIVAQGAVTISNVHFEGMVNGVYCQHSQTGDNTITIDNANFQHLMDRARGAKYFQDGMSGPDLSTTPLLPNGATKSNLIPAPGIGTTNAWNGFSTGVLIDNAGYGANRDSVVVTNSKVVGYCVFHLRDYVYGIHLRSYGHGSAPLDSNSTLTLYARTGARVRNRDNRAGSNYANIGSGLYSLLSQDPASDIIPFDPGNAANTAKEFFTLIY